MRIFKYIFQNKDLPDWIVKLNYASLAGIFAWPLVFFGSIFMFDDPHNDTNSTMGYFFLINGYPVILLLLTFLSFKLFSLNRLVSAILPIIPLSVYVLIFIIFLG